MFSANRYFVLPFYPNQPLNVPDAQWFVTTSLTGCSLRPSMERYSLYWLHFFLIRKTTSYSVIMYCIWGSRLLCFECDHSKHIVTSLIQRTLSDITNLSSFCSPNLSYYPEEMNRDNSNILAVVSVSYEDIRSWSTVKYLGVLLFLNSAPGLLTLTKWISKCQKTVIFPSYTVFVLYTL